MKAIVLRTIVVVALWFAAASHALELNYGGDYIRIRTRAAARETEVKAGQAMHFRLRSQLYGTRLTGNPARSYRAEDVDYDNVLSVSYAHPFTDGTQDLHITADVRHTSDTNVQDDQVDLIGWRIDYRRGSAHRLQGGDISLYGNRYAYQRNLLGVTYQYGGSLGGGRMSAQAGYGRVDKGVEGRRYKRMLLTSGVSWSRDLEQRGLRRMVVDLEYANTRDDAGSIHDDARLNPFTNHVLGLGLDLQMERSTRMRADLATSSLTNRRTDDSVEDQALALELSKRFANGSVRLGWEDVGPGFRALSGSGSPDTQRLHGRLAWRPGRKVQLGAGVTRYRRGSGSARFTTTTPSVHALVQPFIDRRDQPLMQPVRLSVRLSRPAYEAASGAVDRATLNHLWTLSTVVRQWRMGLSYSGQLTTDHATPANDSSRGALGLTLSHPSIVSVGMVQGGLDVVLNRDTDGLDAAPDRNTRAQVGVRSAGTAGPMQYGCGARLCSVDLVEGYDYTRLDWDVSLARRLAGPNELLVGAVVEGSQRSSDAPGDQGDLGEITTRLQLQMSF